MARKLPEKGVRVFRDPKALYLHLKKEHGISPELAGERLHEIKEKNGRKPDDNVILHASGDIYDPNTREWLGSLTLGGAKHEHKRRETDPS